MAVKFVFNPLAGKFDMINDGVAAAALDVAKNNVLVGTRPRLNLIEGTNVSLTIIDDAGNNEVDVTINASGGGGGGGGNTYFPGGWG